MKRLLILKLCINKHNTDQIYTAEVFLICCTTTKDNDKNDNQASNYQQK